jgi:hypothetical protein
MRDAVIDDEHIKAKSTSLNTPQEIGIESESLESEMDSSVDHHEKNGPQNQIISVMIRIETWVLSLVRSIGIDRTGVEMAMAMLEMAMAMLEIKQSPHLDHQHTFSMLKTTWQ